jgi:DNA-binding transcriptional LysR family regulator
MDIRHLRYFAAVAEHLNFGRAARELRMSQPPLSKRIADLEDTLGYRLFVRTNRHVTLTPAGNALLPHARAAVDAFDTAMRAARKVAPSGRTHLRIGFPPDTSPAALMDIRARLIASETEVRFGELTTGEQHAMLLTGDLDIGVLRHPFDLTGLWSSPPLRQTLGVVLTEDHPLATRSDLQLRDLQSNALVIFPRAMAPGLYDEILDICRSGGFTPKRIVNGLRMTTALLMAEPAIAFWTASGFRIPLGHTSNLVWKPLAGEPLHWWTSVVWRRGEGGQVKRLASRIILQALQDHDEWQPKSRPARRTYAGRRGGAA